jgi:hypothetical protein
MNGVFRVVLLAVVLTEQLAAFKAWMGLTVAQKATRPPTSVWVRIKVSTAGGSAGTAEHSGVGAEAYLYINYVFIV